MADELREQPMFPEQPFVKPAHWGDQSKGRNNPESKAAFDRLDEETDLFKVLTLVVAAGEYGITLHECAEAMGKDPHEISGRFTRLKSFDPPRIKRVGVREWKGHRGAIYVTA